MSSALGTLSVRRADTAKGSISHNRKGEPEPRASVGSMGPLLAASRSMSSGLEALRKQNSSPTEGTRSLLPQQWQSSKGSVTIKGNQINPDEDLSLLKVRLQAAEADLARRQESYVRRERAWNERIDELEEEISQLKAEAQGWTRTDENMKNLRTMHSKILNNVELVQGRTSKILQEQERDLLRAFRARLFDVQTELEVERSKRDDGASVWIERSRQTQAELDWAKDIADKLDKLNQSLSQDNSRLRAQFKGQEEDRAFLMKQLVLLKRENAKLRQDAQEAHAKQIPNAEDGSARDESSPECSKITSARPARPLSNSTGPKRPSTAGLAEDYSEERYKDIVRRLKRLLGTERRNLRQARSAHMQLLQQRSELEELLATAVDDVKAEIRKRKKEEAERKSQQGEDPSPTVGTFCTELSADDRARTIELLLSQERVISLLYKRTFPSRQEDMGQSASPASPEKKPSTAAAELRLHTLRSSSPSK